MCLSHLLSECVCTLSLLHIRIGDQKFIAAKKCDDLLCASARPGRILMRGEAENPVSNTSNAASVDLFTRRRLGRVRALAAL